MPGFRRKRDHWKIRKREIRYNAVCSASVFVTHPCHEESHGNSSAELVA